MELTNNGSAAEGTFMETVIKRLTMATSGLSSADIKIKDILKRMRGSNPSNSEKPSPSIEKQPSCIIEEMNNQLQFQDSLLNSIHQNLDELQKLI